MPAERQKISEFHRLGFVRVGELIPHERLKEFRQIFDDALDSARQYSRLQTLRQQPADQCTVLQFEDFHTYDRRLDALVRNSKVTDMIHGILGDRIRMLFSQAIQKPAYHSGVIDWHQDDFFFDSSHNKAVASAWITLDDATKESGCLWMIAGQHKNKLSHVQKGKGGLAIDTIDEEQSIAVELKAGHFLIHHGLAPHRSLPNFSCHPRRALVAHFMDAGAEARGENYRGRSDCLSPVIERSNENGI